MNEITSNPLISNCKFCGKLIESKEGKRPKIFCSPLCRQRDYNKRNPAKNFKKVKKEDFDSRVILVPDENGQWKTLDGQRCSIIWAEANPKDFDGATHKLVNKDGKIPFVVKNKTKPAPKTEKSTPSTPKEELPIETPKNNDKIAELQEELKNLPEKGQFANQRRKFLEKQITELKNYKQ